MADRQASGVQELKLSGNEIDDEGAAGLAHFLGPLLSALSIGSGDNPTAADDQGGQTVRRKLRELDVRRNHVSSLTILH